MSWTGKKQVASETFLARVKRRTTYVTNQTLILLILAPGSAHLKTDWDVIGLSICVHPSSTLKSRDFFALYFIIHLDYYVFQKKIGRLKAA